MTLNAVIALILPFFSRNSTDFQADYITVVVRKILSPSSSLLLLAKTITHPAARSLCDSWASCWHVDVCDVVFLVAWHVNICVVSRHSTRWHARNSRLSRLYTYMKKEVNTLSHMHVHSVIVYRVCQNSYTIFTVRLHVMQCTDCNGLSVRLSICALWQNEGNLCQHSYTISFIIVY